MLANFPKTKLPVHPDIIEYFQDEFLDEKAEYNLSSFAFPVAVNPLDSGYLNGTTWFLEKLNVISAWKRFGVSGNGSQICIIDEDVYYQHL